MILLNLVLISLSTASGNSYQDRPPTHIHPYPPIYYPSTTTTTTPAPSLSGVGLSPKKLPRHYSPSVATVAQANLILTPNGPPLVPHQLPYKEPSDYSPVPNHGQHPPVKNVHQTFSHFSYNAPKCAGNNYYNSTFTSTWCEEDYDYPMAEIETAIMFHFYSVAAMYKEVLYEDFDHDDTSCVPRGNLCPSDVTTIRPRRMLNDKGQWRIVVNRVTADNKGTHFYMTQSARIERCRHHGKKCPVLLDVYKSKCVQKFNYHRFLVFDPYQYYLPFAVDSFKLPSNCNCYTEAYREITDEEICAVK